MMTRIGAASYLTLATLLMTWGAPALAAVQILDNKVAGTLYLINVFGTGGSVLDETASNATALSPTGEVVGYAVAGNTIGFRASTSALTGTEIPAARITETSRSLSVLGVNGGGTIVGNATPSPTGSPSYAFKDDPSLSNSPTGDGPLSPLTPAASSALGINASGQIVGQNNQSRAYLYTPVGGGVVPLADVPSEARAINDSGTVVGRREVSGQWQAFIYDGSTRDLLPSVVDASEASAINAGGDVAGSITTQRGSGGGNQDVEAFLLRNGASAPEALGVAAGFDDSFARGINAAQWVVGKATGTGQSTETAWLWVDGQLFDLSRQLQWAWVTQVSPGTSANQGSSGWVRLLSAAAVGDTGLIVGEGLYQTRRNSLWIQESRAFVLDVDSIPAIPEPGIYLMLLSGLIVIGAVRLRRLGAH